MPAIGDSPKNSILYFFLSLFYISDKISPSQESVGGSNIGVVL